VGAEPSSSDYKSGDRKERFIPGSQLSWQRKTVSKQVQPVASEASEGQSCVRLSNRDNTACEVNSQELNNQAKSVGSDTMQSGESDMTPDSGHVKSSISRDRSWQRNQRPNSQKHTQWLEDSEWKEVRPSSYKATLVSKEDTFGIAKSIVPHKISMDGPLSLDQSLMGDLESLKFSASIEYSAHDRLSCSNSKDPESVGGSENSKCDLSQHSERSAAAEPFDICPPKDIVHKLNPSLSIINKEKRNQIERSLAPKPSLLRNGMVLLRNYISVTEQVKVVNECRKLGLGIGGFYQPGYRDGAKLSLRMMCLGKNWDPETRSYDVIRPIDGAKPPQIPSSFLDLVRRSIKESHTLIAEECGLTERVQAILPSMTPDICLVNFYTISGRLGLHQDRDESKESLHKQLPVVSISIGDSAEFLYGDHADVSKAEKVTLESGDVLIFGGQSRGVFHGVSSIKPKTAPELLLNMTNLRPGRLNLTFREY
ncbi:hypothetical protein V2J09_004637, partial [Rumex salicifolius]